MKPQCMLFTASTFLTLLGILAPPNKLFDVQCGITALNCCLLKINDHRLLCSWFTLHKLFYYLLQHWLPGSSLSTVQREHSCTCGSVVY